MTPMLLEGKIILVSGGTRGLGVGIARAAAAEGAAGIMITDATDQPVTHSPLSCQAREPTSASTLLILPIRSRPPGA